MFNQFREAFRDVPWMLPFKLLRQGIAWVFSSLWAFPWTRRLTYGIGTCIVAYGVFWTCAVFDVMGLNTYEDGWRQGTLADYSVSNRILSNWPIPPGWLFPTGEGDILLGNDSSRNGMVNGKTISPSPFSTTMTVYTDNNNLSGQSVAVHYRRLIRTWFIGGQTDVHINHFEKVAQATLPDHCRDSSGFLAKKIGNIGGKIVEVAKVGDPLAWSTNEIIIHAGGNEFKMMSVVDDHIYDCAVIALKTGQSVQVIYEDRAIRDPITQATTFNVIGIATQK